MRARSLITNRGRGVGGEVKADEATIFGGHTTHGCCSSSARKTKQKSVVQFAAHIGHEECRNSYFTSRFWSE